MSVIEYERRPGEHKTIEITPLTVRENGVVVNLKLVVTQVSSHGTSVTRYPKMSGERYELFIVEHSTESIRQGWRQVRVNGIPID